MAKINEQQVQAMKKINEIPITEEEKKKASRKQEDIDKEEAE